MPEHLLPSMGFHRQLYCVTWMNVGCMILSSTGFSVGKKRRVFSYRSFVQVHGKGWGDRVLHIHTSALAALLDVRVCMHGLLPVHQPAFLRPP
jgi:hypothetical protein